MSIAAVERRYRRASTSSCKRVPADRVRHQRVISRSAHKNSAMMIAVVQAICNPNMVRSGDGGESRVACIRTAPETPPQTNPSSVASMLNCPSASRDMVERPQATDSHESDQASRLPLADGMSQKKGIVTAITHSTVLPMLASMYALPELITSATARTLQMLAR